jgi:HK97 family phage portal protein
LSLRTFMRESLLGPRLERTSEDDIPLASESAWQAQISAFWGQLGGVGFSPSLIDRGWVANTCIDLTASQIARMPLRHYGSREPAWVANPDPVWYPNGVGDAIYAGIDSYLRWGDAFLYITSRYADGYPSGWTILDASRMTVGVRRGQRSYRISQTELDPDNVVQISRDPRAGSLTGSSVIKSYASQAYGLLAASDLGRVMMQSDVPQYALKPTRKVTPAQAENLQDDWMSRVSQRRGAPWVLPPDLDVEKLSFSVADLMLLEAQKFNAQILAASCGVPALFLNLPIEGGLNYQSPAMLGEHWWRFKLRTFATAFTQALSSQMLPAGSYVEFDAKETMAPAYDVLVLAVAKLVESGVIMVEEARAILRLPVEQQPQALADLMTPTSAGASPAQQPSNVAELRPTSSAVS